MGGGLGTIRVFVWLRLRAKTMKRRNERKEKSRSNVERLAVSRDVQIPR